MNTETEQIFLINPESQPAGPLQKLEVPAAPPVNLDNVCDFSSVCRICAAVTEFVTPIFSGEGLQNGLADKIHKHLPIQVSEQDALPKVVCYQCCGTLLAWHELELCCRQADKALRTRRAQLLPPAHTQEAQPAPPPAQDPRQKSQKLEMKEGKEESINAPDPKVTGPAIVNHVITEDGKKYVTCDTCHKNVSVRSWRRHERSHRGERRYSCPTCGLCFSESGNLARHSRALHSRLRPHACPQCHRGFARTSHLADHLRSHAESRDFVCHLCGKASKSSAALRMHRATHDERRFPCVQCGARFKRRGELSAHLSVHTGERAHGCLCGRAFRLRSQLTAHRRAHGHLGDTGTLSSLATLEAVPPPPEYPAPGPQPEASRPTRACEYCATQLLSESYLEHLLDAHSELLFHCDECDTYVARKDFIHHMSMHAAALYAARERTGKPNGGTQPKKNPKQENQPKPKSVSGKAKPKPKGGHAKPSNEFSDQSDAEDGFGPLPESVFEAIEDSQDSQPAAAAAASASASATLTSPSTAADADAGASAKRKRKPPVSRSCPVCGKVYTAASSYFYHMRYFHAARKEHECATCGHRFGTRASLAQHAAVHSAEFPFECRHCHKRFRSKASVYIHEQTHGGAKAYQCGQCRASFRWRTHLKRHLKRHAAERAHQCAACGRGFSVRCDLLRHARTHAPRAAHQCLKCGATFAQLRYLKVHMDKKHSSAHADADADKPADA